MEGFKLVEVSRRWVLGGLIAAPAVVRAVGLMKVRGLVMGPEELYGVSPAMQIIKDIRALQNKMINDCMDHVIYPRPIINEFNEITGFIEPRVINPKDFYVTRG